MTKFIDGLKWQVKVFLLKIKYPYAGYYTRLVLATGVKLTEIDEWVRKDIQDGFVDEFLSIHEQREYVCDVETSYWEN